MGDPLPKDAASVGLPVKPFFYTIEQVAYLLSLDEDYVKTRLVHYAGRSVGAPSKDEIPAVNMAKRDDPPQWRIAEKRLVQFMKFKGIKFYERTWMQ